MTGFQHCCKAINTEIGDPLLNNSQQAKSGQGSGVILQDCMLSATALHKHVQVTSDCHNMLHKLTHTHVHDTIRPCSVTPAQSSGTPCTLSLSCGSIRTSSMR